MAEINAVLSRLTAEELDEIKALGPKGRLGRHLVEALDRAAGGPEAARGLYVLDGSVNSNGGQFHILRDDVSERLFPSGADPR
ncbi:hypothetical protein PY310_06290 [Pseudarthrobacter sp. H3Y2-7]|uniref:hypothetical protein n=1 Tax=Pseudarthrobacter TaxID=1742993 RepID=UPI0023AEDC63|nr:MULTISPECIES: hypothetical protein [unclassified Pseudarthrobacter]MDE8668194.1 hypothetical protein [Pseudarthrobacter sp. H3Y2-7]